MAGSIILMLGVAAIRSDQPGFDLFIIGLVLFFLGFVFWNRWRSKERRSTRFSKFKNRPKEDEKDTQEEDYRWENSIDE